MVRKKIVGTCGCSGFHWHLNGMAHDHEHDTGHHGPAFGRKKVIEVEGMFGNARAVEIEDVNELFDEMKRQQANEPDLTLLLFRSIQEIEAKRRDEE